MSYFSIHSENMMKQLHTLGFKLKYAQPFLKEFNQYCEKFYPNETLLTQKLVEDWIYSSQTKSKEQMNRRILTMVHLGKYLKSIGVEAYVPNYRIKKTPAPPPTLFNDEQLTRFFEVADCIPPDSKSPNREYIIPIIFRLIYSCGLRSSEACKIKVTDIDLINGTIKIFNSKGIKDRIIYMSDSLINLCKNFDNIYSQVLPGREYFFQPSYIKKHYINTDICTIFDKILDKCNFSNEFAKKPTTHGLRHLFAVKSMKKCLNMGYDFNNWIKYLSQYMGHSSSQETMYYLHMIPQLLPEYSKKISRFTEGIGVVHEES